MRTQITYARKRWWLPSRWLWPRPKQLLIRLYCRLVGHDWSPWRVEDEEWFHYVNEPELYAWHACQRGCGAIQRVTEMT